MSLDTLVPDALLADLPAVTGEIHALAMLSGGITNRNYRVSAARGEFVLRMAGARTELLGINRAHEYACAGLAYAGGISPQPVGWLPAHQAMLTRFIPDAATLTQESATARLARIVNVLRRVHAGPAFPSTFDPFETVRQYHALALAHGVVFPLWLPEVFSRMDLIERALRPCAEIVACHNDLLPGNMLDDGARIWLVDWEYAGNGNRFFDLGNFAVNLELDASACEQLLTLYFGACAPAHGAQLNLMRLASDLREAFWGYLQAGISDLDFDFMGYGLRHLARFRANADGEEYAGWLAALT